MNLKPLAFTVCGLLALSAAACEKVLNQVVKDGEEPVQEWQNVLAAEIRLTETGPAAVARLSQLLERGAIVPGVEQVAVVDALPGVIAQWHHVQLEREGAASGLRATGYGRIVSPGYFAVTGVRLFRGRPFSERDREGSPPVVIVNESYARRLAPGHEDLLGVRVKLGRESVEWKTIVGIVQDEPRAQHVPEVYIPYSQPDLYGSGSPAVAHPWYLLVRVKGDRTAVAAHLRQSLGWELRALEEWLKGHGPD